MSSYALTIGELVHSFTSNSLILGRIGFDMTASVTDASFQIDVLNASEPVVVDFWAEWCGPCRMIAPALEEISNEMAGKVKIVKLNVDENPRVAAQFGIRSIPTLMIFKAGELAAQKVGAASKTDLSRWIASAV
jgi:thioredoxin 1